VAEVQKAHLWAYSCGDSSRNSRDSLFISLSGKPFSVTNIRWLFELEILFFG